MSARSSDGGSWILDMLQYGELQDEHHREISTLLLSLLEVMDSFDRVLAEAPLTDDTRGVTGTCQLIARQLGTVLERAKVRPIQCVGRALDLDAHEVVGVRAIVPEQASVVVEVVRRGYEWDGQLLRAAQVIVGCSSEENSS